MSPKIVTESVSATPTAESFSREEIKEIRRDDIFTRADKPFFVEPETFNLLRLVPYHFIAGYMCYLNLTGKVPWSIILIELFFGYVGGLGITVGCHRYWAHKTFKANFPLQIILMIMQTVASQYSIHKWSLIHRIHHKYTDTNADPHNSQRGFWFSHMGWLVLPKHPELQRKLAIFDMSDLERDPIVRFQSKWYWTLNIIFSFLVPVATTYYFWDIPLIYCCASNYRRYVASLHFTWCVNSVAHMWGDKPYDKSITATESAWVSLLASGEGWHNYHHTFPWDYRASEFGWKMNISTMFIDFFAWLGWAHDLKTVSRKVLKDRLRRTGDGSHAEANPDGTSPLRKSQGNILDCATPVDLTKLMMQSVEKPLWGWGDENLSDDFCQVTEILRRGALQ